MRLLDAHQSPVSHARVTVVGRAGAVTTDEKGFFRLTPEPAPPFELAVFSETGGWLGLVRVEQLAEEGVRNIYLPPIEKVEVTVHGGVAPSTLAPPAAAATVISRGENDQRIPARLIEALEAVPGAGRLGSGHGAVPSLRGLARGRTLVLLDDARVTSERRAGPSASYLDPFVLENVEVVRGPGSVAYGSDAMGGIVHMRTPTPTSDEGFKARFELGAGTGKDLASAAVEVNIPVGSGALLAASHVRNFGDYESPLGEVPNSEAEDGGLFVKGLIPAGRTRWVVGLQSDRARDTGKPRVDPSGARTFYPNEESDRLTLGVELPPAAGFSSLKLNAFLGTYRLVTDRETPPAPGVPRQISRSDVESNDASLRLVATRAVSHGLLRVGLDSHGRLDLSAKSISLDFDAQDNLVSRQEEEAIGSARRIDVGIFLEREQSFRSGGSSLAGGIRGQVVSTRNSGGLAGDRSDSHSTFTGYLAYTFRPSKAWSATLQAARGFREPSLSDRYFTGVSGRGFVAGNPDLSPETSRQLDLSVQRTGLVTRFAGYAYLYRIRDLIERFRETDGSFAFRNRGEEEVQGLEIETDVNLGKSFSARLTFSVSRGRILDDGSPAADIPPLGGSIAIHHRPIKRLWWRVSYSLFARDDSPGPTEAVTPGYGLVEASAGIGLGKGLEGRLILGNILDKEYPASPDDDSVLAPGRSAAVVLAGKF